MTDRTPVGLYCHVPFCISKCPYCDFYSKAGTPLEMDAYTALLQAQLRAWRSALCVSADTLYFGGGTPSLLGGRRLAAVLETARNCFGLEDAEITLEVNPADDLYQTLRTAAAAGVNRLSVGMQSAVPSQLRALGRRHTAEDALRTAEAARRAGIDNLSFDLMLGVPDDSPVNLSQSLSFLRQMQPSHVSAYLLKIEPGTAFAARAPSLRLPDEDAAADSYLQAAQALEEMGLVQYEISNFAAPGRESRHNLKYWDCAPYLGLGPAAHAFLHGRRFRYPRDLDAWLRGAPPIDCGAGGGAREYVMLRLRLCEGLRPADYARRFGRKLPQTFYDAARTIERAGLLARTADALYLTRRGFLVSNAILVRLLDTLPAS